MQASPSRELIKMFVARIIEKTFPKETAAARLQQVGLFTLIYMLEGEDEPMTAARLSAITGLADAQVIRQVRKLVKRDLIERTKIRNKQGRGRAFALSIKHTPKTKRLLAAIDNATKGKR
jgi:predicted transcriptional regulator